MSEAKEEIPEGINDLPDPGSFMRPEGEEAPRKRKRRAEDEGGMPNINSLMDIMTILLVFLLKALAKAFYLIP